MTLIVKSPIVYPLTLYRGSDFRLPLRLRNKATGAPYQFVAGGLKAQIRANFKATAAIDITVNETDLTNGGFELALAPALIETIKLPDSIDRLVKNVAVWDLEYTEAGFTTRLLEGQVSVSKDVTRA